MSLTKVTSNVINDVDASKLTGSIADARVPASAVTQHSDTSSLRSDILKLALHQAVDGNRVAYNLDNSFIDAFEDDTGITTETDVDRDTTGEYVSSITGIAIDSNTLLLIQSNTTNNSTTVTDSSSHNRTVTLSGTVNHSTAQAKVGSSSLYFGDGYLEVPHDSVWNWDSSAPFTMECYIYTGDGDGFETFSHGTSGSWGGLSYGFGTGSDEGIRFQGSSNNSAGTTEVGNGNAYSLNTWFHLAYVRHNSYFKGYVDGVEKMSVSDFDPVDRTTPFKFGKGYQFGTFDGYVDMLRVSNIARYTSNNFTPPTAEILGQTVSATGTLISDPQTASSSRTSCSGVIMYENASGTATLGTDLKLYFTANNGTNWTEASSYGTPITYSGSKKLVNLGATTVTGGTQVAMKAVWANQASGSKETRLHGWAVNY